MADAGPNGDRAIVGWDGGASIEQGMSLSHLRNSNRWERSVRQVISVESRQPRYIRIQYHLGVL